MAFHNGRPMTSRPGNNARWSLAYRLIRDRWKGTLRTSHSCVPSANPLRVKPNRRAVVCQSRSRRRFQCIFPFVKLQCRFFPTSCVVCRVNMKFWTTEHTFHHPWEMVAQAVYRKYPNPINPAVLGTDIIDRKVVNGVLYSHRLLSSTWGFPTWAQRLIGQAKICYASELSEVDPVKKELVLKTRNLTFYNYIAVVETLRYTPHPNDPEKTHLTQEAAVTVQGVPLTDYMEDMLTSKISFNANKGRLAMEWVIQKLESEVKEFANSAVKSTDELLSQTRRQLDDLTTKTRRSMDDFQSAARKSFDDIHNLTNSSTSQSMPKL